MLTLNQIVASAANVNLEEYEALLVKNIKPTKALCRLGVDPQLAGMIGTLKLTNTAEGINAVYSNPNILSCMSGDDVGPFYERFGFSLLYNDRYRILIHTERKWINYRGYGFLFDQLDRILLSLPCFSTYYIELEETFVGDSYSLKIENTKVYKVAETVKDMFIPALDFMSYSSDWSIEIPLGRSEVLALLYQTQIKRDIDYGNFCDLIPFFEEETYNNHYDSWYSLPSVDFDELRLLGKNKKDQWVYLNTHFGHYYIVNDQRHLCEVNYHSEHSFEEDGSVCVFDDLPF